MAAKRLRSKGLSSIADTNPAKEFFAFLGIASFIGVGLFLVNGPITKFMYERRRAYHGIAPLSSDDEGSTQDNSFNQLQNNTTTTGNTAVITAAAAAAAAAKLETDNISKIKILPAKPSIPLSNIPLPSPSPSEQNEQKKTVENVESSTAVVLLKTLDIPLAVEPEKESSSSSEMVDPLPIKSSVAEEPLPARSDSGNNDPTPTELIKPPTTTPTTTPTLPSLPCSVFVSFNTTNSNIAETVASNTIAFNQWHTTLFPTGRVPSSHDTSTLSESVPNPKDTNCDTDTTTKLIRSDMNTKTWTYSILNKYYTAQTNVIACDLNASQNNLETLAHDLRDVGCTVLIGKYSSEWSGT